MTNRAMANKVPPYSVHSEKIVLASMVKEPKLIGDIRPLLENGSAFFRPDHGRLYDAIIAATNKKPIESTDTLIKKFESLKLLSNLGGESAIRELADAGVPAESARKHATNIMEKWRMRKLIDAISDILHDAYHSDEGFDAVHARAKKRIADLAKRPRTRK